MAQYVSVLRHWNFRHESKGRNTIFYSALRFMIGMKGLALAFIATAMMAAGALCLDHAGKSAAQIDWSRAEPATVELVDYEFVPNELRLHHDLPYRLHLCAMQGRMAIILPLPISLPPSSCKNLPCSTRAEVQSSLLSDSKPKSISFRASPAVLLCAAPTTIGRA